MAKQVTTPGQKGFLLWVKLNQPKLYDAYRATLKKNMQTLKGLGDDGSPDPTAPPDSAPDPATSAPPAPASSSWADATKNILLSASQVYLAKTQIDNQSKLLDTQLARARAGLPPLNIDPASYGLQPTIGVGLSSSTQKLVMYGLIGIGALLLLNTVMKHR
jgi:hypothetical protein